MTERFAFRVGSCACLGTMLTVVLFATTLAQTQWNKLPSNPVLSPGPPGSWDQTTTVVNTVLNHEGIYKMWYEGDDSFGYATSNDGITWVKSLASPVMQPGPPGSWDENNIDNASVVIVGNTYHMFYSAEDASNENRIGHATSPDGITWTKDPANPVLAPGASSAWDDAIVALPFVTHIDSLVMYYGGSDGVSFQTGYAGTASMLVPTLLKNHTAAWRGSGIEVTWTLSEAGTDMWFSVLRSQPPDARYVELDAAAIARSGMSFSFTDAATEPGASYRYAVQVTDEDGRRTLFETDVITAPNLSVAIERVTPNPFNPRTTIEYTVATTGPVTLGVYDAAGRLVRMLVNAPRAAGRNVELWNGADERGAAVASGVYFVRLESAGQVKTQKAVLAK